MPDLIIVLGHFDDTVHLTSTGRERLDAGMALHRARTRRGSMLTVTGCAQGRPRTLEVQAYLSLYDATPVDLIDSHNTAEDAYLTEALVVKYAPARLVVVTSDYHVERSRFIFEQVFTRLPVEMCPVPHVTSEDERCTLNAHESHALEALRTRGLYRPV
jgi:hypothetical protein